jgi:subtilisin-like proprotein convertase family protein
MHRPYRRAALIAAVVIALVAPSPAEASRPTTKPGPPTATAMSGAAFNRRAALAARFPPGQFDSDVVAVVTDPTTLVNNPAADTTARDTQSETSAVAVGTNVVVAYNDSGSYTGSNNHFTGWSVSTNSGNSFTDMGALPNSPGGDAGDPVLAANQATGRVYLATLEFNSLANIQLFRSDTGGQSFQAPVNATPGMPAGSQQDKEWMAVDNFPGTCQGNVYLGWRQFGGANEGMQFTRSTDHGATWGPSGGLDIVLGTSQGAYVAVGPDHSVYYFWLGAGNVINVRKSTDCGVSFGPTVLVTDILSPGTNGDLGLNGGFRSNAFPHVAVHPVTGAIFVVFNDDPAGVDRSDVYYVSSTNGGSSWSPRVRMNTDATTNDQFFPTIAFTPNGNNGMVSWYDRRNDAANLGMQRYGRVGKAPAGTLALNTEFAMSPVFPVAIGQDPVINPVYMGDYDQIAATDASFFPVWGDNRDGNSVHANQPDVRYAKVPAKGATDVSLAFSDAPDPVTQGGTTTFSATVTNTGTKTAQVVFLTVKLGPGLVAEDVTPSAGTCYGGQTAVCRLGRIPAGATVTVQADAFAAGSGTVTTTASLTTGTKDPDQSDNNRSVTTTIDPGSTVVTNASTGNIATPLADVTTTNVPITVSAPAGTRAVDVNVSIRANHTYDSDVQVSLISPDGTQVMLANRRGADGDNFGSGTTSCAGTLTGFDDSAATPIGSGVAPFNGTFTPDQPLAGLQGATVNGTWTLRWTDLAGGDSGTMFCVNLAITRPS